MATNTTPGLPGFHTVEVDEAADMAVFDALRPDIRELLNNAVMAYSAAEIADIARRFGTRMAVRFLTLDGERARKAMRAEYEALARRWS